MLGKQFGGHPLRHGTRVISNTLFTRYLTNEAGNFSIIAAIVLIPLLTSAGLALDYTRLSESRSRVQQALDAGTMAAAIVMNNGGTRKEAVAEGRSFFASNCPLDECSRRRPPRFRIKRGEKVTGTYRTYIETTFMRVAGFDKVRYNLASEVALNQLYTEFHIAIDRSASLGIAADDENVKKLQALTVGFYSHQPEGCQFACHEPEENEPFRNGKQMSSYELAREAGILLREDVLLDAVDAAAVSLLNNRSSSKSGPINVAAYAFSDSFETLVKPTASKAKLKRKIKKSKLRTWGTRYDIAMPDLIKRVGKGGNGTSSKDRQKTVILITDGQFTNYWDDADQVDWFKAFDQSYCGAFKNNGVRVVVVNVEYPDLSGNDKYEEHVASHRSLITKALQSCATEGFYYVADDHKQIEVTMSQMVREVLQEKLAFSR
ncbi:MAG: TadE/TadG family type IV pilus assembly protein [Pseudomonadota bacterium]